MPFGKATAQEIIRMSERSGAVRNIWVEQLRFGANLSPIRL